MSAQTLELEKAPILQATPLPSVDKTSAHRMAVEYAQDTIGRAYEVTDGEQRYSKDLERDVWRFMVRCEKMGLGLLHVDAHTGKIIPLTDNEICVLRERRLIHEARKDGVLPLNADGHVVGEYARRSASHYLDRHLSMHYSAAEPLFVPGEPPLWQTVIIFRMAGVKPVTFGLLDVNANTGEPLALSEHQIEKIRERSRAIIAHQAPATRV